MEILEKAIDILYVLSMQLKKLAFAYAFVAVVIHLEEKRKLRK